MTEKTKSPVAGRTSQGDKNGNGFNHPQYTTNGTPVQEEMDLACWLLEIADGLTGPAYLAMLTLALQHIEAAGGGLQ